MSKQFGNIVNCKPIDIFLFYDYNKRSDSGPVSAASVLAAMPVFNPAGRLPPRPERELKFLMKERPIMNNIPEVKLGIIAVSRDCFPIALSTQRRKNIVAAYGEGR